MAAPPDATLALRDLFAARSRLGGDDARLAARILARPTDGGADPYGDGFSSPSFTRCSAHFCLHWVRRGADAPATDAWPATTLAVLERVWRHHVDTLGYRTPVPDGARGGSAKFDVYLKDVGSRGLYGYCAPEGTVPGQPKRAGGFCVLDDDFARDQFRRKPADSLKVTAAHEFLHAIQFAYDVTEDAWLYESTATWVEERFADEVDDNRSYLPAGQLGRPRVPLDLFETDGFAQYGNWAWWEFLSRRYGTSVVRSVWNRAGTGGSLPDDYSTQALVEVLASRGGLPSVYAAFAAGNTVPSRTYAEGRAYPTSPATEDRLTSTRRAARLTTRLDHLTSRAWRLRPDASLARGSRLTVVVDAPDRVRAPAARLVAKLADGTVRQRAIPLGSTGSGRIDVGFDAATTSVTVVLVNASTRYRCDEGTSLACEGRPFDDGQQFAVRASVSR